MALPPRDLMDASWDSQVAAAVLVEGWMYVVADSRMAYWAVRERMAFEIARMSSYAFSDSGSSRDLSCCG